MKERANQKGLNLVYKLMDVRKMDFPKATFDAVIDKGKKENKIVLTKKQEQLMQ